MKDGGSSADGYFECLANHLKFAVRHAEGPYNDFSGDQSCPAAFCTAHHSLAKKTEVCGMSFMESAAFTILREPVSRMFSLFNFYKYVRGTKFMQGVDEETGLEKNFHWLVKNFYKCHKENFADALCPQFNNDMTFGYLAPNAATIMFAHGQRAQILLQSRYQATNADLEVAKKSLSQLDAIFFTEELGNWSNSFRRSGLPFSESASLCAFPHVNECATCGNGPDQEARRLATEMNVLDIELYEYAKTLPNHYAL